MYLILQIYKGGLLAVFIHLYLISIELLYPVLLPLALHISYIFFVVIPHGDQQFILWAQVLLLIHLATRSMGYLVTIGELQVYSRLSEFVLYVLVLCSSQEQVWGLSQPKISLCIFLEANVKLNMVACCLLNVWPNSHVLYI